MGQVGLYDTIVIDLGNLITTKFKIMKISVYWFWDLARDEGSCVYKYDSALSHTDRLEEAIDIRAKLINIKSPMREIKR